ncbi:MAG: WG repeat-containing protein [Clostridia bacterium]|nr:WG repeat-containing protein [Clostridia bacterium]
MKKLLLFCLAGLLLLPACKVVIPASRFCPAPAVSVVLPTDALANLAPRPTPQPLPELPGPRYFPYFVLDLLPNASGYGPIQPFFGIEKEINSAFPAKRLYGICDAENKIIADPCFDDYRRIDTADGKGFWVFTKYSGEHKYNHTITDSEGRWAYTCEGYDYPFLGQLPNVPCTGRYWPASNYLPVQKNGKWGAIDTDGNLVLPCEYFNPPYISDGLAAVANNEPKKDDRITYRYIDLDGNVVLDGFTFKNSGYGWNWWRFMFSEGVALRPKPEQAEETALEYELMDKTGKRIWQPTTTIYDYDTDFFFNGMILFNDRITTREGAVVPASILPSVLRVTRAADGTFYIYYERSGVKVIGDGMDRYFPGAVIPSYPQNPNLVGAPYVEGKAVWLCYGDTNTEIRHTMRLFSAEGAQLAEVGGPGMVCRYDAGMGIVRVYNESFEPVGVYDAGGRKIDNDDQIPKIDYPAQTIISDD